MIKPIFDFFGRIFKPDTPDLHDEEICTQCGKALGYSKSLNIHDPKRLGNYVEGGGQSCSLCAKSFIQHPHHVSEYVQVCH